MRLFYHAGLKPALVARGMARIKSERILRFAFRATDAERWEISVRENILDLQTLREFFAPGTFWLEQFPKIEPRVVYDIGANIGVSLLFFSTCYPRAKIYGSSRCRPTTRFAG